MKKIEAIIKQFKLDDFKKAMAEIGDGKIFVLPLDEVCRIRTGEKGKEAI